MKKLLLLFALALHAQAAYVVQIQEEHLQADGRRWVRETQTDDFGVPHVFYYLKAAAHNSATIATTRQAGLTEQLKEQEGDRLIETAPSAPKYLTLPQLFQKFRQRFQQSERHETMRLAWWILKAIQDGVATETQVRNAFGLSAGDWVIFKTKLEDLRSTYNKVEATKGE